MGTTAGATAGKVRRNPAVARVLLAARRYLDARGNRLAGAVTYFGFLSVFPLTVLAAAVAAALAGPQQIRQLQAAIEESIPGIADKVPIEPLVRNAGSVGVIGALLLLVSGLGWVDAARGAIRTMWGLEDAPGNMITLKLADVASLVGLAATAGVSILGSTLATTAAHRVADLLGVTGTSAAALGLRVLGVVAAVLASILLFFSLLVVLPRIHVPRGAALQGAVIGGIGFEILKYALASYIGDVAGKNVYGAFGAPVALLLWINFVSRLLLFCSAWTATAGGAGPGDLSAGRTGRPAGDTVQPTAEPGTRSPAARGAERRGPRRSAGRVLFAALLVACAALGAALGVRYLV
ncbi:MAG: YihY/virulence factor BrkB family protein, partial [Carbonactinosporaceae bacterium]